jgi:phospholipid/cholesterol/gamma-HCH transport system substrate-binding protein
VEPTANYKLVGTVVSILLVTFIIGGLWLSYGLEHKTYMRYMVHANDSISGLSEKSLVKFNGVKVGYVKDINLDPSDPQQVNLLLYVDKKILITASTQATIVTQGITGTAFLSLYANSRALTPLKRHKGDVYPVIPYVPSFFSQIEQNFEKVGNSIKDLFSQENTQALHQVIIKLPKLVDSLENMAENMSNAGANVSKTVQSGHHGINKISQAAIPPIVDLLRNIEQVSANLYVLSDELKQNPAMLLRGKEVSKLGPGEH